MSCEICGRYWCTRSFHSFEEQESFDNVADKVKDRVQQKIYDAVESVKEGFWHLSEEDGEIYVVPLHVVLSIIDEIDL